MPSILIPLNINGIADAEILLPPAFPTTATEAPYFNCPNNLDNVSPPTVSTQAPQAALSKVFLLLHVILIYQQAFCTKR